MICGTTYGNTHIFSTDGLQIFERWFWGAGCRGEAGLLAMRSSKLGHMNICVVGYERDKCALWVTSRDSVCYLRLSCISVVLDEHRFGSKNCSAFHYAQGWWTMKTFFEVYFSCFCLFYARQLRIYTYRIQPLILTFSNQFTWVVCTVQLPHQPHQIFLLLTFLLIDLFGNVVRSESQTWVVFCAPPTDIECHKYLMC